MIWSQIVCNLKIFKHHFKRSKHGYRPLSTQWDYTRFLGTHMPAFPPVVSTHTLDMEHVVLVCWDVMSLRHTELGWEPDCNGQGQDLHKALPHSSL